MKENSIKTLADFAEYLGENYGCGVNKSRLEYTEIPEIAAAHGWVLNHNSIDDDLCIDLTAREVLIATNNQPSPVQYIVSDFDDFGEENPFEKYRIVASTDPYHAGLKYHRGEVLESSNGTPTEWVHDDNGGFGYT
ncbi:MAG: hypothetical protein LUI04_06085, partial [Porphyromonadaceae bacterium]|nr:hypothetical protein [Porphyromonadaceae bacterium]